MNIFKKHIERIGEKELHQILNRIEMSNLKTPRLLGELIKDIILTPYNYVLYVDELESQIILLKGDRAEDAFWDDPNNVIRFIFNLISTLQSLEKDHYIYCVNPPYICDKLLYDIANDFYEITKNLKYRIADNQTLERVNGEWVICQDSNMLFKECFVFNDNTYTLLNKYLQNFVLPTQLLSEYINNYYLTKEENSTKESLHRAKVGNWIAVGMGICSLCVTPFINTCISNNKGETKIKEDQFNEIIRYNETIRIIRDTVVFNKLDTINCVIIEDKSKQRTKTKK